MQHLGCSRSICSLLCITCSHQVCLMQDIIIKFFLYTTYGKGVVNAILETTRDVNV